MLAPPPEQWVVLPSPASCLLCCLLHIYHLCWVSIRLYFMSTVQSLLGWIVHCQHSVMCICVLFWVCTNAIARYYIQYVFVVLHYCQRSMLCMFCSCCTTASAGCYVCLVCVALLPAQSAIYVLFVSHCCQCNVPLLNTASTVCRCWTLPAQWAVRVLR